MNPIASFFSRHVVPLRIRTAALHRDGASQEASIAGALRVTRRNVARYIDLFIGRLLQASQPDLPWALVARHKNALIQNEQECDRLRAQNQKAEQARVLAEATRKTAEDALLNHANFLAVIAHELRGPLAAVRFATASLGAPALNDIQRARIRVIVDRQVEHASRLVEDLLDLTRARTGKMRLVFCRVDVRDVIDAAVAIYRPAMAQRRQKFVLDVPSSAVLVSGDSVRLAQVLGNLLENASRYTPEGGVITLSTVVVGDFCVLTVADSGIGMTAEATLVAFEAFSQEAHAVAFNGAGLGVGLTVVRELVEAHFGTVTGRSAGRGRGSEFVVSLPLAQTFATGKSSAAASRSAGSSC